MKWIKVSDERPPFGEFIWVWDMAEQRKILMIYRGSEETWLRVKDQQEYKHPLWAPLNEKDEDLDEVD